MLAYAPRPERRRLNRTALVLILGAHAAAIVAVMSAKLAVDRHREPPIVIRTLPIPEPQPDPEPTKRDPAPRPNFQTPKPIVEPPPLPGPFADPLPPEPLPPLPGNGTGTSPTPPKPLPIVRTGPRFVTSPDDIRPPYPDVMRAQEREAELRLKLSIDERGRVVAVEPVGKADPTFLAAARRHILKAWRYAPAMEGEQAIASSTVVTLKFELD